jgi:hypothetical protein
MKAGKIIAIILAMWGLVLCPSLAEATLITIEIEGVVDYVGDPDGYLEGKIKVGDTFTGSYTYDSDTPDSSPLDLVQGNYWHYAPPAGISLTVGGFDFKTDPANVEFRVALRNDIPPGGSDVYSIGSSNNLPLSNGTLVESVWWQLNDNTGSALSSDALPTIPPTLDRWQANVFDISGYRTFGIRGHVTTAIPEPATIFLFSLGGLFLRKRR